MFTINKKLTKIGDGVGVIIPRSFLANLEWTDDEEVAVVFNKDKILIEKPK